VRFLIIRPENKTDHPTIYDVNQRAFNSTVEPELVDRLRDSEWYIPDLSLVAEKDGRLVGHILFTRLPIRRDNGDVILVISMGPLAVLPEHQNSGIGSQLVTEGLKRCREMGYGVVVLVGHPEYYPRFGFVPARTQGFSLPLDAPDEAFMVAELIPGQLRNVSGAVEYPPEWGL